MVGPNKQFDESQTLAKALDVFWNKGYEATSMQDLVGSMGINRASMYQTYGNKHALFLSSLDMYIEASLSKIRFLAETLSIDSDLHLECLEKVFMGMIEHIIDADNSGCFLNNTTVELGSHDPEIAEKVRDFSVKLENIFTVKIQQAIDNNELAPDSNAMQISSLLNITLQGLMVKSKTNKSKHELNEAINLLFTLIRQSKF
jgi:TetR/AcrR family transcriptional repressor of nem operon